MPTFQAAAEKVALKAVVPDRLRRVAARVEEAERKDVPRTLAVRRVLAVEQVLEQVLELAAELVRGVVKPLAKAAEKEENNGKRKH